MIIDESKCVGCEACIDYCPVGAISIQGEWAVIDRDACVECGVCYREVDCPGEAFVWEELSWPRVIRRVFSDPTLIKKDTKVTGRGTEEMKTNDVTGRFKAGQVGLGIELGRPSVGASFRDVEKMSSVLAKAGIKLEEKNPLTKLINQDTGEIDRDILDERVLSAILEFVAPLDGLRGILKTILSTADELETVFSLDLIYLNEEATKSKAMEILAEVGISPSLAGKTNVGLGRPLAEEGAP
jgi:NAD-dependent dihydropyrimidine dehydrogenase PreA subunit